jgi:hypothetical protein
VRESQLYGDEEGREKKLLMIREMECLEFSEEGRREKTTGGFISFQKKIKTCLTEIYPVHHFSSPPLPHPTPGG